MNNKFRIVGEYRRDREQRVEIRMNGEDMHMLDVVADAIGMKRSATIRELIRVAYKKLEHGGWLDGDR